MADHYFRVSQFKEKPKKRNFILSWLSGLSVTGWLILVNAVSFFVLSLLFGAFHIEKYIYLQPYNLFINSYYWTLLTSMSMHSGFIHLFINMLSLFFVGRFLETIIGRKRFFWLYIISGLFAGLFFAFLAQFFGYGSLGESLFSSPETFAVGASGAIFSIAGVLCFLTPRNKVYLIAGPLIAIAIQASLLNFLSEGIMNILGFFINIYIFISIFSMFSINSGMRAISLPIKMSFWLLPFAAIIPLVIIGLFVPLPIGNTAHLGGLIAGMVYGIYLRLKYPKKSQRISDSFSKE